MFLFIPRSLCALKRITAKGDSRYTATQGIRIALAKGMYRAEATDGHRAIVVQGTVPTTEPPWPAFKDVPDDAFEAIIMPKDLERACKVGDDYLQSCFGLVGIATMGNDVCLGLGADVVTARMVEGKFPPIDRVIPRKRPLFTFRVDPRTLGDTLLAIAALLPETDKSVQFFYYGEGIPLGFCARNNDNGNLIDALVVPLSPPSKDKPAESPPANDVTANSRKSKEDKAQGEENSQELDGTSTNEQPAPEAVKPSPKAGKRAKG